MYNYKEYKFKYRLKVKYINNNYLFLILLKAFFSSNGSTLLIKPI